MRTLGPEDARPLHALLAEALGETRPLEEWWEKRSGDPEFDADLCFLVHDPAGRLAAAALSWTAAFLKDLVVHPSARRLGIGEALMKQVFATFRARGAAHVDLKTNLVENADAVRLYRRLGMVEVDWAG
jgi:ribosomal protein S18 acetylase RimI-like enzyme